jgi:protocatechuate 3,4-dioxygenase beta subunit
VSNVDAAGEGPFFIHDGESMTDIPLFRQDIRGQHTADAEPGIELHLHLQILDGKSADACNATPLEGLEVYIWHTDAMGYYSGFTPQNPDQPYSGTPNGNQLGEDDRFCRGAQVTNADGIVSFRSIFPGWYNGRDIHIHLVVLKAGSSVAMRSQTMPRVPASSHVFTTQLYFHQDFNHQVHEAYEPYKGRTTGSLQSYYEQYSNTDDNADNSSHNYISADLADDIVVGRIKILVDPTGSDKGPNYMG